ncbi:hypothetical protein H0266_15345 [Halobacillus locisalis]|uniref:DUF4131 domain-containing protein n=1 Tax=Halobacillus locisalis TaxID=220753 RepID=A0A838CVU6_9BACI|nr:hypothetical protein [Halobacillus locisalis]MBA2176272.1 hypothetical protein [Halobacillus locisalis]
MIFLAGILPGIVLLLFLAAIVFSYYKKKMWLGIGLSIGSSGLIFYYLFILFRIEYEGMALFAIILFLIGIFVMVASVRASIKKSIISSAVFVIVIMGLGYWWYEAVLHSFRGEVVEKTMHEEKAVVTISINVNGGRGDIDVLSIGEAKYEQLEPGQKVRVVGSMKQDGMGFDLDSYWLFVIDD